MHLADSEMSGSNTKIEWYLARDGQQHGPLSDPELKKFIELGHLHPTDLVWRAGFPEWRTASEVFPETAPAAPPPPEPAPTPSQVEQEPAQSTASDIEDITLEQPSVAPVEQQQADSSQIDYSDAENAQQSEPANDVTRPDSPTQRDYRVSDADRGLPTNQASPSETNQTPSLDPGPQPTSHSPTAEQSPSGEARERTLPSPSRIARPGQLQQPQTDPRAGNTGQPPNSGNLEASAGPNDHAGRGPSGNAAPSHSNPQAQDRGAHQPYGAAAGHQLHHPGQNPNQHSGQQPGQQPHPQNAWQATSAQMGGPQQAQGGPQQSGANPGYGAGNPNMYGHPGAGIYPGGQPAPGAPGGRPAPGPHPNPGFQQANGQQQQRTSLDDDDDFDQQPRRRPIIAALVSLVLIAMIGAGGWFAYTNQDALMKVYNDLTKEAGAQPGVVAAPGTPARVAADNAQQATQVKTAAASPERSAAPVQSPAAVASYSELPIFQSQFWRSFNALYPAWAKAQESNAGKLQANGKSSDEVLATVVKSVVEWRRSNADKILAASPDHLRTLAKTFVANLKFLVTQDVQACYGYISKGELSPTVLPLFGNPTYVGQLGIQTEAIIAAAQNGTTAKQAYAEPINKDFTDLTNLLVKRGWSEADLKMFSDPTELSTAPASKVCTLVTQWFETQLQMPPSSQQMRLLATSLQPVVRG